MGRRQGYKDVSRRWKGLSVRRQNESRGWGPGLDGSGHGSCAVYKVSVEDLLQRM